MRQDLLAVKIDHALLILLPRVNVNFSSAAVEQFSELLDVNRRPVDVQRRVVTADVSLRASQVFSDVFDAGTKNEVRTRLRDSSVV